MAKSRNVLSASIGAVLLCLMNAASQASDFKLGVSEEAISLDPIVVGENGSIWVQLLMYDTLIRPTADATGLEPGLAESWTASDDGKIYDFKLRANAKFSDGTPVTAADVIASLRRAGSEKSQWANFFKPITGLEALDDRTVRVKLDKPFTPLLNNLALFTAAIFPEKQATAETFPEFPTASGPFILKEWRHGERIILEKNPYYWQAGKPSVDTVEIVDVPEDTSRLLQLQSGELDAIISVPYNQMAQLKANPDLRVGSTQVFRTDFVMMNNLKKPFDDVRVRQALNYAVDKSGIVDGILFGNGTVATTSLPIMAHHNETLQPYAYDVEAAKKLLKEAGLENGFSATMLVGSGNSQAQQTALAIQNNLAQIGVQIQIQQVDDGTHWDLTKKGDYEMAVSYVTSDTIDPDQLFGFLAVNPERASAYHTNWKNEELNALYAKERVTPEGEERAAMFKKMEELLHEGAPYIFLDWPTSTYAHRANVTGFKVLPTSNWRLEDVIVQE